MVVWITGDDAIFYSDESSITLAASLGSCESLTAAQSYRRFVAITMGYSPRQQGRGVVLSTSKSVHGQQTNRLAGVVQALAKAGFELSDEQSLKRLPKGFDAEKFGPVERALRLNSHTIHQPLTAKEMGKRNLVSQLGDFAETALPLLEFGWKAG